jgi:hypothetical protein
VLDFNPKRFGCQEKMDIMVLTRLFDVWKTAYAGRMHSGTSFMGLLTVLETGKATSS